jgi:threonine synthase
MSHPPYLIGLRCMRCGTTCAPDAPDGPCGCRPNVGSDVGTLDAEWDYARIARDISPQSIAEDADPSMGRFWPLLPIERRSSLPPLPVGPTPLLHAQRLGASAGFGALFLKDDGRTPSASFKDRASAVAVARATELGAPVAATASTGNAAAALAVQAAAVGLPTVIFVPRTAPAAKVAQLLAFGSTVLAVDGSYDDAFDLCMEACATFGWYNRNTGYNPYMSEGKKSVSLEMALQLAAAGVESSTGATAISSSPFAAPDAVFVSVGDGCIIGGVYKGFFDLLQLGWIDRMPRIFGVQSTRSPALANAWLSGAEVPHPVHATTRADSISVDAPRDPLKALRAVRESGGAFVLVEDEAILSAILPLARLGGVFAEPAGAAAWAGAQQALRDGLVAADACVIVINTGSGLKDVPAAMQAVEAAGGGATLIAPTLEAVRDALGRAGAAGQPGATSQADAGAP